MSLAYTKNSIGIGITTKDRGAMARETIRQWRLYTPADIKIVVVDDASAIPVKDATFRFKRSVGIARAKNKCLELLDNCEHIFLSDDDVYPIAHDWWVPYINSGEKHLSYIFPMVNKTASDIIESTDKINIWSHPRGCLLYIHYDVLDRVGGMNTNYGKWGYEHKDWSNRIHNAGLTPYPYMDVIDSHKIFKSLDQDGSVGSTIGGVWQSQYTKAYKEEYEKSLTSNEYKEYKDGIC